MAGDWIKMRGSLNTHPKVLKIASIIGGCRDVSKALSTGYGGGLEEIVTRDVTRDVTLASLLRVWCAANEHTRDGRWSDFTPDDLDIIAGVPGFGAAMHEVGWAVYDEENNATTFPNFLEYNAPAKNGARSKNAERQRRYRERQAETRNDNSNATRNVTQTVTRNVREEKRREESLAKLSYAPLEIEKWEPGKKHELFDRANDLAKTLPAETPSDRDTVLKYSALLVAGQIPDQHFNAAMLIAGRKDQANRHRTLFGALKKNVPELPGLMRQTNIPRKLDNGKPT